MTLSMPDRGHVLTIGPASIDRTVDNYFRPTHPTEKEGKESAWVSRENGSVWRRRS